MFQNLNLQMVKESGFLFWLRSGGSVFVDLQKLSAAAWGPQCDAGHAQVATQENTSICRSPMLSLVFLFWGVLRFPNHKHCCQDSSAFGFCQFVL